MIGAARELDCFGAHIRLREPDKSEDKASKRTLGVEKVVERGEEATTSPEGFSYPKKQSIGQKGGGLGGVSYCCRGGSIDHEERDADARQRIVGLWAWQLHGTAEAGLSYSHQSLALMEGERWL
ncbi:hypothetical protein GW17_00049652 [Ensete ventricosum]|nr:hypothetical protein GW17_00049652 [Ensete ventricosum]